MKCYLECIKYKTFGTRIIKEDAKMLLMGSDIYFASRVYLYKPRAISYRTIRLAKLQQFISATPGCARSGCRKAQPDLC